jgi:hypothetical protein|tara:strand:+ start:557 stop:661 length:105 start_codon:yes stop_codon:yes gene_type:complete
MPTARRTLVAGVVHGKIFVLGGESSEGTFEENEA